MTRQEWMDLKAKCDESKPKWKTLALLAGDILAVALSWFLCRGNAAGVLLGWGLLSWALVHFYLFLHEATHSALFRNSGLNRFSGNVLGWCIGMPFLARQRSHLLHHIWTGHPKGDPSNERLIQRFSVLTTGQAVRLERIWRNWIPLITINDRIGLWRDPFRKFFMGSCSGRIRDEVRMGLIYLLGYVLLVGTLVFLDALHQFLIWYVPALLILFLTEELANLPHHAETPLLAMGDQALPYWEQHRVTHSCRSVAFWSRWVLLNFNLHTAHHFFPSASWEDLPRIHNRLLREIPGLAEEQQTRNELQWSLQNRRRPLLQIMGHYFDHVPKT